MDLKHDMTGKVLGMWTVLRRAPNNRYQDAYWVCRCSCPNKTERAVKGSHLRRGLSTNCGCVRAEKLAASNQLPSGEGAFRQLMNRYRYSMTGKEKGFHLTLEDGRRITKQNCFYCGKEPAQKEQRWHNKKTWGTPYIYNGIDRIDSSKGYTVDNCVAACGAHNKMKLNMSTEDFLQRCIEVVEYFGKRRVSSALPESTLV